MLTGRKPERVADVLLRVDWEVEAGGDHFVEATSLKSLPLMLASIDAEGGTVIRVLEIEELRTQVMVQFEFGDEGSRR